MENQARLDVLEGRVEELSRHWDRLFGEIGRLDHKIDTVGVALSSRIDALDQKFDRRFEVVDRKMDDLRAELSKQFRWTFSTMNFRGFWPRAPSPLITVTSSSYPG